jgi:hypothetical protein
VVIRWTPSSPTCPVNNLVAVGIDPGWSTSIGTEYFLRNMIEVGGGSQWSAAAPGTTVTDVNSSLWDAASQMWSLGPRGQDGIAELCRREGIFQNLCYRWSKDFLEAGKKRLDAPASEA